MGIVVKKSHDKIIKIQDNAVKAIGTFTTTLDELLKSNDDLQSIIDKERETIAYSESAITKAKCHIQSNNKVIARLKEFVS